MSASTSPIKLFTAALAALFLSACNPMAQLDGAEESIAKFHSTYNSGDARALYGTTADDFREVTTPAQMVELVELVTDRMGKVETTQRKAININSENGTTLTVVTMTTMFEKGEAIETFTYQGNGADMKLVGWNVDSPNFSDEADGESEPEAEAGPAE